MESQTTSYQREITALKKKQCSRKGHYRSENLGKACTQEHEWERTNPKDMGLNYNYATKPRAMDLGESVQKKIYGRRESKNLRKRAEKQSLANIEQNDASTITEDTPTNVDSRMCEIEKRYRVLLPAIKLAMETIEQTSFSKNSSLHGSGCIAHDKVAQVEEQAAQEITSMHQEVKRSSKKERRAVDRSNASNLRDPTEKSVNKVDHSNVGVKEPRMMVCRDVSDSADLADTFVVKHKRAMIKDTAYRRKQGSKTGLSCLKVEGHSVNCLREPTVQSLRRHEYSKKDLDLHVRQSEGHSIPNANGEAITEKSVRKLERAVEQLNELDYSRKRLARKHIDQILRRSPDPSIKRLREQEEQHNIRAQHDGHTVMKDHLKHANILRVEQNVLYSSAERKGVTVSELSSAAVNSPLEVLPSQSVATFGESGDEPPKPPGDIVCKCKGKLYSPLCICACTCEEEKIPSSSATSEATIPNVKPSEIEETPTYMKMPTLETRNLEAVQVQTSFPSSIGPCGPETCPKRRKMRQCDNREIEIQTDDTDIEWQYEPPIPPSRRMVISSSKIPPKRTTTMDDRLLRRIMYFDCHQSSVCNKDVQFCTYTVHLSKKGFPSDVEKASCPDCPGVRKCNVVLQKGSNRLSCNEISVEIDSLHLNQDGLDSLMKVCSFVYIDYVFLGHVGNETNLAPLSEKILFDSRKSYSVSMRFNKKERSILREQCNPSGLLVKDSIMFILVCQAAPDLDINKNWDFGFGYLSMKQVGEQAGSASKLSFDVEMQKIGGTKSNIGRLTVTFDGLQLIVAIIKEELHCIEPQVNAVMKKLKINQKELKAAGKKKKACSK